VHWPMPVAHDVCVGLETGRVMSAGRTAFPAGNRGRPQSGVNPPAGIVERKRPKTRASRFRILPNHLPGRGSSLRLPSQRRLMASFVEERSAVGSIALSLHWAGRPSERESYVRHQCCLHSACRRSQKFRMSWIRPSNNWRSLRESNPSFQIENRHDRQRFRAHSDFSRFVHGLMNQRLRCPVGMAKVAPITVFHARAR
jgi:hypothetical protein